MAKRRKNKFKRFLIIWALILLIAGEILLIYVDKVLIEYEKGNVTVYMDSLVKDIKSAGVKGNIDKYFKIEDIKNDYEKDSSLKKGYQELFKEAEEISYKKCTTCSNKNSYILELDGKNIATINLKGDKYKDALLILNYPVWEVESITTTSKGLYDIDIYLDKDLTLLINNQKISDEDYSEVVPMQGYDDATAASNIPYVKHFVTKDLTKKPKIKVVDSSNKEIEYTYENGKYYANQYFKTDDEKEAMTKLEHEFDILEFAELWSKFLTEDLTGSYHGYYQITPYMIENTALSKRAYNWAHNVDITFTSNHYLENPPFTGEKLSNFVIYNSNAFSVDVYLEKNMVLTRSKSKRVDVMNDTLYIVYDNGYKIASMISITE